MIPNQFYITLKRIVTYIFWLTVLITAYLTLIPSHTLPTSVQIWDKAEHAITFFVLMFTGSISFSKKPTWLDLL